MSRFLARFLLGTMIVFIGYAVLVAYTHAVYEQGWDDGIEYSESLDEEWDQSDPNEEIRT